MVPVKKRTLQNFILRDALGALLMVRPVVSVTFYSPSNPLHMNIFVSRLSHDVTELHLELLFGHFGTVDRAKIIRDMITGESRQFGFVEMQDPKAAREAINKLHGAPLEGSKLVVKEAEER